VQAYNCRGDEDVLELKYRARAISLFSLISLRDRLTGELVCSQGDVTDVVVAFGLVCDEGEPDPGGCVEVSPLYGSFWIQFAIVQSHCVLFSPERTCHRLPIPRDLEPKLRCDAVARL
jgi:hypothetical protein